MKINLETLIKEIDEYVNEHPYRWGRDFDFLWADFVMRGYCPKDVSFAMSTMADRNWEFKDGRKAVHCSRYNIPLTEQYCRRVYAHKTFHTGELKCLH